MWAAAASHTRRTRLQSTWSSPASVSTRWPRDGMKTRMFLSHARDVCHISPAGRWSAFFRQLPPPSGFKPLQRIISERLNCGVCKHRNEIIIQKSHRCLFLQLVLNNFSCKPRWGNISTRALWRRFKHVVSKHSLSCRSSSSDLTLDFLQWCPTQIYYNMQHMHARWPHTNIYHTKII